MESPTLGLLLGVALIAFGLGHATGARAIFAKPWIDAAILIFIGSNILIFAWFGMRP